MCGLVLIYVLTFFRVVIYMFWIEEYLSVFETNKKDLNLRVILDTSFHDGLRCLIYVLFSIL